jgi:uncharacterized membrane protein YedE/YeeE
MQFSFATSFLGGALIGLSASLLWAFNGKIAGVSGMVAGLITPGASERSLRGFFIAGLLLGGGILLAMRPDLLRAAPRPLWLLSFAGIAVGAGTHLGSGCTSGHGVCGISRGARRSFVAVFTFMATGALAASLTRMLLGAL